MDKLNFNSLNFNDNLDILNKLKDSYLKLNLPHSLIIYGEKGIGKSTFIKYLTNKIFNNFSDVQNKTNDSNHTTLILNDSHPNFMIISRLIEEKNNQLKKSITIDQIRNLESFIYQTSLFNLPKIILIDTADDLNISSSHALLKILEEPKKNTYFFLISNQLSRLFPTIKSRCVKFKFNKPSFDEFNKIILLNDKKILEKNETKYLYDLSNGSPGVALQLSLENISDSFEKFISILKERKTLSHNILEFSSKLSRCNNDQYITFLSIVKFTLLNIIKINLGINLENKLCTPIFNNFKILSKNINTFSCYKALNYLDENENNLFVFNLDKKLFTLNLFSEIVVN